MIQKQARRLQATFLASDVAATCAALLAAYVIRFETVWPIPLGPQPLGNYASLLPVVFVLWPVVFYFHRLYQLRRDRSSIDEALAIVMAASLATLLLVGLLSFWRAWSFNRALLILFLLLDILLVALGRFAIWRYLEKVWAAGVGRPQGARRRRGKRGPGHRGQAPRPPRDRPEAGGLRRRRREQAGRGVPRARRPGDDRRRPGAARAGTRSTRSSSPSPWTPTGRCSGS